MGASTRCGCHHRLSLRPREKIETLSSKILQLYEQILAFHCRRWLWGYSNNAITSISPTYRDLAEPSDRFSQTIMAVEGSSHREADAPPLPGLAEYHDGSATESGILQSTAYVCRRCPCVFCFCMYLKPFQIGSASVLTLKVSTHALSVAGVKSVCSILSHRWTILCSFL